MISSRSEEIITNDVEGYCQYATELDRYGNAVSTCDAHAVEFRPDRMFVRFVCVDHR